MKLKKIEALNNLNSLKDGYAFKDSRFSSIKQENRQKRMEMRLRNSRIAKFLIDKINKDLNINCTATFSGFKGGTLTIKNLGIDLSDLNMMEQCIDMIKYFNAIPHVISCSYDANNIVLLYHKPFIDELKESKDFKNFNKSIDGIEKFDL